MKNTILKPFQAVVLLLALALPQLAPGAGLGAIEVRSYLNEPLEARIPLSGLKVGELESLRVGLAGAASFERAGIQRSYLLTRLKFSTETLSNGQGYIRIHSRKALREPGLSLIVQVASSTASLERRYNILLSLRP